MKGSLIQLAAQGSENLNINMNPEISFFSSVYKRYTNFTMESIEQHIPGKLSFNSTMKIKINKEGDLMSKSYLQVTLPSDPLSASRWVGRVGFNLIKKIELIIGNTVVDKMTGLWMNLWAELTHTNEKKTMLDSMVGTIGENNGLPVNQSHTLNIPLMLFFSRHYSLALPLVALGKQEIFIKLYMNSKENCIMTGTPPTGDLNNALIWIDYIYVETEEKENISSANLEYIYDTTEHMIKSLNTNGINNIPLPFKFPSKELVYVKRNNNIDKFTNYGIITQSQLKINSKNIFSSGYMDNKYTSKIVPFKCHTGKPIKNINCISFSVYPESLEPSGILNFNHVDKVNLLVNSEKGIIEIFSFGYNVLKINNGIATIEYK